MTKRLMVVVVELSRSRFSTKRDQGYCLYRCVALAMTVLYSSVPYRTVSLDGLSGATGSRQVFVVTYLSACQSPMSSAAESFVVVLVESLRPLLLLHA